MTKKAKSENVQVIVRVRPLNKKEKERGEKEAVVLDLVNNTITVATEVGAGKAFAFDAVYNNSFSQKDVYLQSIHPVVETVLQGFNATIFAYGQSGTGKTYSMAGVLDDPKQLGITPNALNHIFDTINNLSNDNMEYNVMASFVELYNGKCRDLLVDGRQNLELKENQQKQFYVKDLSVHVVKDTMDAMRLMDAGLARREVKSTDLNADSSRSHSLFAVYVRVHDKVNDVKTESKLNLVDLAGSERQKASGATGDTLTEGNNINQSLTALGMVIDCLVKNKPHIPYRSSPLTMLLKDGLGGNSRTVIVGTCSPSEGAAHETVSSLRFLDRAKQIKNKPKVQMDPKDAKIAELQEEVKSLKARLGIVDADDEGGEGDPDAVESSKQNYIRSFDSEVETLRRRVEELEVQAHLATEAEEAARGDLSQMESKMAAIRAEYEVRHKALEEKMRREAEEKLLQSATEGSASDDMTELVKLIAHFIEAHDEEKQWKVASPTKTKKGKENAGAGGITVDDIAAGLRIIEAGGFERKMQAALAKRSSFTGGAAHQHHQQPPLAAAAQAAPSPASPSSPKPPAGPRPAAVASPTVAPAEVTATSQPPPPDSPAMDGVSKPKKEKKDKDKKEKKEKKEKKVSKRDSEAAGLLSPAVVEALFAAASVPLTPVLITVAQEIMEAQRDLVAKANAERMADMGASAVESPEDAAQLVVAYEALQEDLTRVRAQLVKQRDSAGKVKEIADRRAEEVEALKKHVDALREELAAKHSQHAAESAMQQDQLISQHNKKVEVLMQKHSKALVKEKKLREKLSQTIDEWEEKYAKLEQDYDVKIMEYEALQQNYEQQKLEQLKKYREMAQGYSALGGGGSAGGSGPGTMSASVDTTNERLRKAITKMQNGTYLNSNYNGAANDGRLTAHSAPDPSFPPLGSDPRPPAAAGATPNFSRNFLDATGTRRY